LGAGEDGVESAVNMTDGVLEGTKKMVMTPFDDFLN